MTSDKTEGTDFTYPEGYAEQIAHAVNNWAYLESNINRAIWALAKTAPALGACITSQIASITGRLNALLALMKTRHVSAKLIKRVTRFSEDRRGGQPECTVSFRNADRRGKWRQLGAKPPSKKPMNERPMSATMPCYQTVGNVP